MMFWFYFIRPIRSLLHHWEVKLPLAVVATTFWSVIDNIAGVYANLLHMPAYLLAMASAAFFFDFASAVLATLRDKGFSGIQLIKFRQLLIKAAYWTIIIFTFSNLSSGAEEANIPILHNADVLAVMWLTIQDAWSTLENWRGDEGAAEWLEGMMSLKDGDLSIDQITTSDSE